MRQTTQEERSQNATAAAQHVHRKTGAEFVVVLITGPAGETPPTLTIGAYTPSLEILREMLGAALRSIDRAEATLIDVRVPG